jgi:hypothetical protein
VTYEAGCLDHQLAAFLRVLRPTQRPVTCAIALPHPPPPPKGALDGGLDIPHNEKRFVGWTKEEGLEAEVRRHQRRKGVNDTEGGGAMQPCETGARGGGGCFHRLWHQRVLACSGFSTAVTAAAAHLQRWQSVQQFVMGLPGLADLLLLLLLTVGHEYSSTPPSTLPPARRC